MLNTENAMANNIVLVSRPLWSNTGGKRVTGEAQSHQGR